MDLKEIIDQFLTNWEHRDIVDGVLLTGSRSVGNEKPNSDVDLQILLSDDSLRERGNQVISGIMVEYFANPSNRIMGYLQNEVNSAHRPTIRMYATGKILIDHSGMLKKACELAKQLLPLPLPTMAPNEISYAKYSIWDCIDDLEAPLAANDGSFRYVCSLNLNKVLNHYCRYLGAELTSPSKQALQFGSSDFRAKYAIEEFPDQMFSRLFLACLNAGDDETMYNYFKTLGEYVLNEMGGYNIDGWRSRIPV